MSGMSKRIIDAGYELPKFLADVDKKPMILNVLDLFPKKSKFIIIINEFHYENFFTKNKVNKYNR